MTGNTGESPTALYGSDATHEELRESFTSGSIPVAVHGLGRIGLPLAAVFAEVTGNVTGVDVDESVVAAVQRGESPIDEPGLPDLLATLVEEGALAATTDPGEVEATVHVVVVPTLLDDGHRPDLSMLLAATRSVGRALSPGDLVVVESTVPPGTCTEEVAPALVAESGLERREFGVAHCPERTTSGRALRDIRGQYPRVVGGVDDESTRTAALVYGELTDNEVIEAPDARTAECVKLFEGVYRDVNIALANELARLGGELGVDVPAAIRMANTQPYCDLHAPGPGVGGHCIPYYPHFLAAAVQSSPRLIHSARSINEGMPAYTAAELARALSARDVAIGDARVLLAGLTYRSGVAETAESPARDLSELLTVLGAEVYGVDPLLSSADDFSLEFVPLSALDDLASGLDAVVVVTPHEAFERLDWDALDRMVVVDGRDALDLEDTHHDVVTLGDGSRPTSTADVAIEFAGEDEFASPPSSDAPDWNPGGG